MNIYVELQQLHETGTKGNFTFELEMPVREDQQITEG